MPPAGIKEADLWGGQWVVFDETGRRNGDTRQRTHTAQRLADESARFE
jgi:hypothetical protein